MSAGFGFSVGDFIAALKIVSDVIDALRESGNSTIEYRRLLRQLYELETALIHVRRLELNETQADELHALRHSALQCRTTIDEFMEKIRKYQPHLHSSLTLTNSMLKQSWYKVKWALCQKEDIDKFRADLAGHTEAINILMNAILIQQTSLESKTREHQHFSLKGIIKDFYDKTMRKLSAMSDAIANSLSHSQKLLEITAQTAQMDCKIFGAVLDVQDLLRGSVAPQILRAQPVYFIDALGVPSPFHLEFIRSSEAFLTVLRHNMKGNDMAVKRINRGEFAISDATTKCDIDLLRPWHMCFRPGQRADMSMIVEAREMSVSSCPSCKAQCSGDHDSDIVCTSCGLTFRRLTELKEPVITTVDSISKPQAMLPDRNDYDSHISLGREVALSQKRKREDDVAQELRIYRRIRLWQPSIAEQQLISSLSATLDDTVSSWSVCDGEHGKELIKSEDAIEFFRRVKMRYREEPETTQRFLNFLQTYQSEVKSTEWVLNSIKDLFYQFPDLIEAFAVFLPETTATALWGPSSKSTALRPNQFAQSRLVKFVDETPASSGSIANQNESFLTPQPSDPIYTSVSLVCDICDIDIDIDGRWYRCSAGRCADPQNSYDVCRGCYIRGQRCPGYDIGICSTMLAVSLPDME